ncbi:tripartite tricarboxylate transporter substrate binding protein [Caldovatus aquaticus]|uniref:Tripartite tricarboxylate transporter substrate binding protein n=1 Tax=Caldovatus aquaticus TaxID=2865671 RepID=A0ABS7F183_9PROT|nr:tripartite tricarboxylate transporter substrate binding protein [Caldovatus aquaticus]
MTRRPGIRRRPLLAAGTGAALAAARPARAQEGFPGRAVRIVVPYAAGGPSDIIARAVAERLFAAWRQPVVVENRPGAGAAIGAEHVARAAPDGHTLLLAASAHVMNPPLMPRLPYHPVRDFTPILQVAYHPMILVVHPAVPANSFAEFLELARRQPGGVTVGSAGVGNASHLAAALLGAAAGFAFTHVPYNGSAPAMTALLSGQVQCSFLNATVATQQVRAGRLRGLAATGLERWRELPELPAVAELGHAGFEVGAWYGFLGPAQLPAPVLAALHRDIAAAVAAPAVRERIAGAGLDPRDAGPAEFRRILETELAKWERVVRDAGIRAD